MKGLSANEIDFIISRKETHYCDRRLSLESNTSGQDNLTTFSGFLSSTEKPLVSAKQGSAVDERDGDSIALRHITVRGLIELYGNNSTAPQNGGTVRLQLVLDRSANGGGLPAASQLYEPTFFSDLFPVIPLNKQWTRRYRVLKEETFLLNRPRTLETTAEAGTTVAYLYQAPGYMVPFKWFVDLSGIDMHFRDVVDKDGDDFENITSNQLFIFCNYTNFTEGSIKATARTAFIA